MADVLLSRRDAEHSLELGDGRVDGFAVAGRLGYDVPQDGRLLRLEADRQLAEPDLLGRILAAGEGDPIAENILLGLQVAQEKAHGVEDRLHRLAGDVE